MSELPLAQPHESHLFYDPGICIYCDLCMDARCCPKTVEPCDNKIGRIVAGVIGLAFKKKEPSEKAYEWTTDERRDQRAD